MLSCIVTTLKFRAIQLLYLSTHRSAFHAEHTGVWYCIQLNTGDLQTNSRKLTEYFEHSRSVSKRQPESVLICSVKVFLFWRGVRYKATCKSFYTHGKQPITLCMYCEPFTRAPTTSLPINCLFFQNHDQSWIQRTERHLC